MNTINIFRYIIHKLLQSPNLLYIKTINSSVLFVWYLNCYTCVWEFCEATMLETLKTDCAVVQYLSCVQGRNVQVSSLLCGDLNSQPNSSVYKFLSTGRLPEDCLDWASSKFSLFFHVKNFFLVE
ncbi:hypothetical protein PR048_018977 [Dryococelus australis]|uniref:Endonuclease/exonuclease/phosphatase domain-containing protein n=1 Tax=Dryococelus australis TaxID=614101 RepID=A0ABQ9H264_9NEOP|nr:hypothetical protein PR048_018977 [Dryococelus australis]